jgi:hypothetical protein
LLLLVASLAFLDDSCISKMGVPPELDEDCGPGWLSVENAERLIGLGENNGSDGMGDKSGFDPSGSN